MSVSLLLSHMPALSSYPAFSQLFASQAIDEGLDDNAYANKIHLDAIFSKLKHLLVQYKPTDPLSFLRILLDWVLNPCRQNDCKTQDTCIALQKNECAGLDCGISKGPQKKKSKLPSFTTDSEDENNTFKLATSSNATTRNKKNDVAISTNTNGNPVNSNNFAPMPKSPIIQFRDRIGLDIGGRIIEFRDRIGLDIGGSLCKICFYEPDFINKTEQFRRIAKFIRSSTHYGSSGKRDQALSFKFQSGKFHFLRFETNRMEGALGMIGKNDLTFNKKRVPATGGGAFKFGTMVEEQLGVTMEKQDEMKCLIKGLNFLLQTVEDECYYLEDPLNAMSSARLPFPMSKNQGELFPYLLVNIGSGVSMLRVDGYDKFERVGGSFIGGATYLGLLRLITDAKSFAEAMDLSISGTSRNVHMLVSDIYGGDYTEMGLNGSIVAAAFGKLTNSNCPKKEFAQPDMAAGLLHMVGANIAQLSYLTALNSNINKIIFAGNFLRRNAISSGFLSKGIDYWSQGKMRALFLKHEGYFGSIGCMMNH